MSADSMSPTSTSVPKPSQHETTVMIWLAVFPTLVVLNVALNGLLKDQHVISRTFVLATVAVPIVVYGLMPVLHRLRGRLITRWRARAPK